MVYFSKAHFYGSDQHQENSFTDRVRSTHASYWPAHLQKFDDFAGHVARVPCDCDLPEDIRQHTNEPHREICQTT